MNTQTAETGSPSSPRSKYLAYVGWAMVLAVGVSIAAVAIRTVIDVRHDEECRANLKRIGVALQNYEDRYGSFPPACVLNEQGQRWHSWRVLLLPDLGHADLYAQYRFDTIVFDRPFLIYLQERQAKPPYFVMWVENPEVLVPHAVRNTNAASGLCLRIRPS